jgi:hypothetical protein
MGPQIIQATSSAATGHGKLRREYIERPGELPRSITFIWSPVLVTAFG